jgi:hypothetical protein
MKESSVGFTLGGFFLLVSLLLCASTQVSAQSEAAGKSKGALRGTIFGGAGLSDDFIFDRIRASPSACDRGGGGRF